MNEIKIIEPKTKIWASRERTVQIAEYQPEKIVIGISEAIDEELTADQKKTRLGFLADIVEEELNARVSKLTGEKREPSKAPEKAVEDDTDQPEFKICAKCGGRVERQKSKFERDDGKRYYYRCSQCKTYKMGDTK